MMTKHRPGRVALVTAVLSLAGATAGMRGSGASDWLLVVDGPRECLAIDGATGARRVVPGRRPGDAVSPDGRRVAYVDRIEFRDMVFHEMFVAGRGRSAPRQLTSGVVNPREIQWMPDSEAVVYVRGTGARTQVYLRKLAEKSELRVSAGDVQSWHPRVASDGRIAYLALREQKGKERSIDLVVRGADGKRRTILRRKPISTFAWSPDGRRIAWSTVGGIEVIDLGGGEPTRLAFREIDRRLAGHQAVEIAWHPEGGLLAARIVFAGGRASRTGEEPGPLFGDEQVFLIPEKGATRWIGVPAGCTHLSWRAKQPGTVP